MKTEMYKTIIDKTMFKPIPKYMNRNTKREIHLKASSLCLLVDILLSYLLFIRFIFI